MVPYKTEEEIRNYRRALAEQVKFLLNKAERIQAEAEAEREKVREVISSKKYSEEEMGQLAKELNLKTEKYLAMVLELKAWVLKLKEKFDNLVRD